MGLKLGASELQVQRSNYSVTPPPPKPSCVWLLFLLAWYKRAVLGTTILPNGKGHFGPTDRNDQTGRSGPTSKLVPNIPVGPNQNGPFHLILPTEIFGMESAPDSKGPRSRFRIFPDRESRITLHGAKEPSNTIHYPSLGMLMKGSKSNHIPGAHNPELATPMLGLCHGVFTDQFIFRHIVGHFFGENRTSTMSMSAFEVWRIKKENQMLLKGKNIIFRSVGFCWLVCGI